MILVGLGNPGDKYSATKHNFGYWVIDSIINKCSLKLKVGKGDYIYAQHNDSFLVKPTSYMNSSGVSIKQIMNYYKSSIKDLIVIYDDIDLPLGTIRFRDKGGAAGHRGIENTIYQLRSESFLRLRLGIAIEGLHMRPSEKYVLSPFPKEYQEEIDLVIKQSVDGLEYLLDNGIEKTMNKFN
tara:strand:- start:1209 stop:1754 length:546 start_codon:yes stop_codon:yes gene_type:complete